MPYEFISLERKHGIAHLTLDRPERLNAVTIPLRDELLDALAVIASDETMRCVVLSGRGRAFCTGQDLGERAPILAGVDMDLGAALNEGLNRVILALTQLPQPVVGAVQGAAVGAGASLALACDILIAAENARFHFSFAKLGLSADGGASWFLSRKMGPARAASILLRGDHFDAATARDWGLVSAVVPPEKLEEAAITHASAIAQNSPIATRAIKSLLAHATEATLAEQLAHEAAAQTAAGRSDTYKARLREFLAPKGG